MLCRALDELAPALGLSGTVFTLEDPGRIPAERVPRWRDLRYEPCRTTGALVARLLRSCALDRPRGLLVGHVGMSPLGILCSPFLGSGFGIVAHGVEAWDVPRLSRRVSVRCARRIFAVSSYTGEALRRASGVDPAKIRLLPNTLDDGVTAGPSGTEETLEILSVCRLEAGEGYKGIDHALRAFAKVAPRYPGWRYRVVGKGSDKSRHVELARSLGIADRVLFEEDLDDPSLGERYRRCAVFLLPSGREGFGIVFLEAMRFGKPCIGGLEGGTPEVVVDGETGILVPYGDVGGIERALDRLLASSELRKEMGDAGRQRLDREFRFEGFRDRLESHLHEWIGE